MKYVRKLIYIFGLTPLLAFAQSTEENPSVWESLFVASFPILLIIAVFFLFIKVLNKKSGNINERILESNLKIAKELKRIADHIEKNT